MSMVLPGPLHPLWPGFASLPSSTGLFPNGLLLAKRPHADFPPAIFHLLARRGAGRRQGHPCRCRRARAEGCASLGGCALTVRVENSRLRCSSPRTSTRDGRVCQDGGRGVGDQASTQPRARNLFSLFNQDKY